MNNEAKEDVKKFNELRDNINTLWNNIEKDNDELLNGKEKDDFVTALENASNFVNKISWYYDTLDLKQRNLDCNFDNLKKRCK